MTLTQLLTEIRLRDARAAKARRTSRKLLRLADTLQAGRHHLVEAFLELAPGELRRLRNGEPQKYIAREAGTSQSNVSMLESGNSAGIGYSTLIRLLTIYGRLADERTAQVCKGRSLQHVE
jgi:transcriptional regulator with XRE-family HTH domain